MSFSPLEIHIVFEDIKTYGDEKGKPKFCALCNDGRPLRTYTKCDGCGKYFCLNHRPMFTAQWFCPICENSFQNFVQPLKTSNIKEFLKRIG